MCRPLTFVRLDIVYNNGTFYKALIDLERVMAVVTLENQTNGYDGARSYISMDNTNDIYCKQTVEEIEDIINRKLTYG